MKTINELAKSLGVSRQTLYNIVNAEHLSIDELTTEKLGKTRLFDDKAEAIVKELLSKRGRNVKTIQDELDNMRRELAEAKARIRDQADELDKLRAEADALREDNRVLIRTNATNAVTIQRLQDQALLPSAGADHAEGWIRRTIRRIRGGGAKE